MRNGLIVIYVLSLILCSFTHSRAQSDLLYHSAQQLHQVYNIRNHKANHRIINHFLKEISRGNGKNAEEITLTFYYRREIKIFKMNDSIIQAEIMYTPVSCGGDIFFRKISIEKALFPSHASTVLMI